MAKNCPKMFNGCPSNVELFCDFLTGVRLITKQICNLIETVILIVITNLAENWEKMAKNWPNFFNRGPSKFKLLCDFLTGIRQTTEKICDFLYS